MRALRPRSGDDAGASLILAMAFMTFLGLVIGSLLTYSGTSIRSTNATQAKAESTYDIDGALQAGANQMRTTVPAFTNAIGQPCPSLNFPGPNTGSGGVVTCVGGAGTGGAGGVVAINPSNRPTNALLTLGTSDLGLAKGSNNVMAIRGDVYHHNRPSSITQSGPSCPNTPAPPTGGSPCSGLWVAGKVTAKGTCGGLVVASGGKSCSNPAANPAGVDPAYPQPAGPLVYQPVPACGAGNTVSFDPGYYDDAVGLTALTNGGCTNKTLHFRPGTYFFDFHNGDGPVPAGAHVWTINDVNSTLLGGTPLGWAPGVSTPVVPGACVSPLTSAVNGGVQFVFGGDSRIDLLAGKVELCGQYSLTRPPITLFGATSGPDPLPALVVAKTDGTGTNTGTGPTFATPTEITEANDVSSDALIVAGAQPVTAEVTVKGFKPPTLPPGSIVTKAEIVVKHRDESTTGSSPSANTLSYTPDRAGAVTTSMPVSRWVEPAGSTLPFRTDRLDVTTALAAEAHRYGLDGLTMKYATTVSAGQTIKERIDSIQLELTWKPPGVRGQTSTVNGAANCVGAVGGCALLQTSGSGTKLYMQGTTYAPLARLDIKLTNASAQVFRAGIIVRSLKTLISASVLPGPPMIDVPDIAAGGPATALEVYFRAYICPQGQASACSANPAPAAPWRLSGTARVRYETLTAAGYGKVTVLNWTVRGP